MNYSQSPVIHAIDYLFTQLSRGFDIYHYQKLENICKNILQHGNNEDIEDLVVLTFHTRDICGKGEKSLGIAMLAIIFSVRPDLANMLVPLIPEYGCWKDMWKLYEKSEPAREVIDFMVFTQFRQDQESEKPSLLVKYLPREGGARSALAKHFAGVLFAKTLDIQGQRMRIYRKTVASLNRIIDTTEIKMCGGVWSTINPERVSSELMRRNKNAFFNKPTTSGSAAWRGRNLAEKDRIDCARNFKCFNYIKRDPNIIHTKFTEVLDSPRYYKVREAMLI